MALNNGKLDIRIYVAYDNSAAVGELFYAGTPIQLSITNSASQRELILPE